MNSRSDAGDVLALLKALLVLDTNKHLTFAIESLSRFHDAGAALVEVLKGRMDRRSRDILKDIVRSSTGRTRIIACGVLQLVCDESDCLALARSLLRTNDADLEETAALLLLLGDAAYYTGDASVVDLVRPYAAHKNRGYRVPALLALRAIPGEAAETELRKIAESTEDEFASIAASFLERRKQDHGETASRRPSGWRQGYGEPDPP